MKFLWIFVVSVSFSKILCEDAKDYRLPKTVQPKLYQIAVTVDKDFPTTKKFKGHAKILVNVTEDTSTIVMHSANITYVKSLKFKTTFEEDVEKMILKFEKPLKKGFHTLEFSYEAILHEDMNGFYLSYYEDVQTKEKQWMATTQFQATYARRAFPCFDEPEFKAEFQINVTRPSEYNSLSNSVLKSTINSTDSATDIYEKTPKMSSYLVAIIISKFKGYGATKNLGNKRYDVYCTESSMKTAGHAYSVGEKFIDRLSKYTGIDYYKSGIPKLYQVAIPDFSAGAMENWGLVTFREADLLFDETESRTYSKSKITTIISHEFAHMWFGDMVTTEWWSTTWLNEGFAEYFSYFITEEIQPEWEVLNIFVVDQLQSIFHSDALSGAFALTSVVSSPEEVADKFNMISYSKGAAIVRMMHYIVEDKPFLDTIRQYLTDNMYKNTKPSDLWKAFSDNVHPNRLPKDTEFETVMSTWTEQPGFPVVSVSLNGNDVVLTQKRFLLDKSIAKDDDSKWYVPITFTTSINTNFTDNTLYWLTPNQTHTLESVLQDEDDWIVVNLLQYGYYRVRYESELWDRIQSLMHSKNFEMIDPLNRAQIIDDTFNLGRIGLIDYNAVMDMTLYLTQETNYYPWSSAISGFSFLRIRTAYNKVLEKHILKMMTKLYDSVSFNITSKTPYMDVLKTSMTLSYACYLNHPDCLEKSKSLFEEYKKGKFINPNLRATVYCSALRQSRTSDNWNFLWKKYLNTSLASEKEIILDGLACTRDKSLLLNYLKKSITKDSGIRKQDASSVFISVLTESNTGYQVGCKFFKENIKEIAEYYGGMGALSDIILTIANRITTKDELKDFDDFLKQHPKELKEAVTQIENALENARSNLEWSKEDVLKWLNTKYSSGLIVKASVVTLILGFVCTVYV